MTKKRAKLLFLFLLLPMFLYTKTIDNILFMTENYPPYNFKKENKLQGIAVDTLVLMLEGLDSKQSRHDIKLLPWSRGYYNVLRQKNTSLFSTTRTKEREKLFKWVGPISKTVISLIAKKNKHIKINTLNDISNYKVGVVRDDIGEQLIDSLGISPKHKEDTGGEDAITKLVKMLNRDRFDLLVYEADVAEWEMKTLGLNLNNYERVFILKELELYYAFHKDTPNTVITLLQKKLDELKEKEIFKEIIKKYK